MTATDMNLHVTAPIRELIQRVDAGGSVNIYSAGDIKPWAAAAIPSGWLECDGRSLARADYTNLFAAIGETWGAADNDHFNLPDFRGRVLAGRESLRGVATREGARAHILTTGQLPAHNHTQAAHSHGGGSHNHSMPDHGHGFTGTTHSHGGPSHSHTVAGANHSHTLPNHSHGFTGASHSHSGTSHAHGFSASHVHSQAAHGHSVRGGASGTGGRAIFLPGSIGNANVGNQGIAVPGTMDDASPAVNSATVSGTTGAASTGSSGSATPGGTVGLGGAGSTGSGASASGNTGAASGSTGSAAAPGSVGLGGSGNTGNTNVGGDSQTPVIGNNGSGESHPNIQPTVYITWIIYTGFGGDDASSVSLVLTADSILDLFDSTRGAQDRGKLFGISATNEDALALYEPTGVVKEADSVDPANLTTEGLYLLTNATGTLPESTVDAYFLSVREGDSSTHLVQIAQSLISGRVHKRDIRGGSAGAWAAVSGGGGSDVTYETTTQIVSDTADAGDRDTVSHGDHVHRLALEAAGGLRFTTAKALGLDARAKLPRDATNGQIPEWDGTNWIAVAKPTPTGAGTDDTAYLAVVPNRFVKDTSTTQEMEFILGGMDTASADIDHLSIYIQGDRVYAGNWSVSSGARTVKAIVSTSDIQTLIDNDGTETHLTVQAIFRDGGAGGTTVLVTNAPSIPFVDPPTTTGTVTLETNGGLETNASGEIGLDARSKLPRDATRGQIASWNGSEWDAIDNTGGGDGDANTSWTNVHGTGPTLNGNQWRSQESDANQLIEPNAEYQVVVELGANDTVLPTTIFRGQDLLDKQGTALTGTSGTEGSARTLHLVSARDNAGAATVRMSMLTRAQGATTDTFYYSQNSGDGTARIKELRRLPDRSGPAGEGSDLDTAAVDARIADYARATPSGRMDVAQLPTEAATTANVNTLIQNHADAADPHGDRAYADTAISQHVTDEHGTVAGEFVLTNISPQLNTAAGSWSALTLNEPLEPNALYFFRMNQSQDIQRNNRWASSTLFTGQEVIQLTGQFNETHQDTDPDVVTLVYGRTTSGGALNLHVARRTETGGNRQAADAVTDLLVNTFVSDYDVFQVVKILPRVVGGGGGGGEQSDAPAAGGGRVGFRYAVQTIDTTAPPDTTGITWVAGRFTNVPMAWVETIPTFDAATHALWILTMTGHDDETVTLRTERVSTFTTGWSADGDNWHSNHQAGDRWLRHRNEDGTWGPAQPIAGQHDWWAGVAVSGNFSSGQSVSISPAIDLDDWQEFRMIIKVYQNADDDHPYSTIVTTPARIEDIGNLAQFDVTSAGTGYSFKYTAGPTSAAMVQYGDGGLVSNWTQYGLHGWFALRRATSTTTAIRELDSIYFSGRSGSSTRHTEVILEFS